jgi:hypothetical protein
VTEHRAISGRRKDLTSVRRPELLRRILLDGPGISSLAGIERMNALETVLMESVKSPELERLVSLPSLRELVLGQPRGKVRWQAVELLAGLERLVIDVDGAEAGAGVASIDFGRLSRLRELRLSVDGARVQISLGWLGSMQKLRWLTLANFVVDDEGLDALCEARSLEGVFFTPLSPVQTARLADGRPGLRVTTMEDEGVAPLGTIIEHGREYSLGLDLAGMWDLETNIEAEERLVAELRARLPEVAGRVRYDTESSAVWVLSERRQDLEAVERLATEMAEEGT